jgi:tetratricopeptide (TPR) repeat protein
MLSLRIVRGLIFLLWLVTAATNVQAQSSCASSAATYLERGNKWMKKGEIERAIADYGLAIATDALSAAAYYNRGVARRQKGDLSGELSDWDRAIELNPRYADAYLNRGALRYRR